MRFLRENKRLLFLMVLMPMITFPFDREISLRLRGIQDAAFLHLLDPLVNFASHGLTLIASAVILYLVGTYLRRGPLRETGRLLIISFVSAGTAAQFLKHLFGRARPVVTGDVLFAGPTLKGGYDSFPSGHTTVAFSFAFVLSHLFPRYSVFFYAAAVFTGFERVMHSSHFFSDVCTGAVVGLFIGNVVIRFFGVGRSSKELQSSMVIR
jgi:membrane-associated phospholipid phosphatase